MRDSVRTVRKNESGNTTLATIVGASYLGSIQMVLRPIDRKIAGCEPGFCDKENIGTRGMGENIMDSRLTKAISVKETDIKGM